MDRAASSPVLEPRAWAELLTLSADEAAERSFLERLLDHWARAHAAEAAGLYVRTKIGGLEQEAAVGKPLPVHLEPAVLPPGAGSLPLSGGLLVFAPAEAVPAAAGTIPGAAGGDSAHGSGEGSDPVTLLLATCLKSCRLKRELKEQQFQVNYRVVELEALYDVGLAVAATLDLDRLSEEILLRAVSLLDARRGALYILEDPGDHYRLSRTFGGEAAPSFALDNLDLAAFLEAGGPPPDDLLPGAVHVMGVPIEMDSTPRGLIAVGDKESRRGVGPFLAADRRTLALFANQAAIALENARLHLQALEKERLDREMHVAAEIQRQILPKGAPEVAGFRLIGWNLPARQVGGDYYDFFVQGNGHVGLVVGDVSGKGIPAALLVSTLHSALSLMLDQTGFGPSLLDRLNRHILASSISNKFITMLVAELDPKTGGIHYLNAGHNPGLLLRRDGSVEELGSTGLPLGLLAASRFQSRSLELEPGDLLCLYSDGITECENAAAEEFGVSRLVEVLRAHEDRPLPEMLEALQQALARFSAGLPQGDDQTLILLQREAGS
ncbi:MAG TPA: SpoIIE family protein phosphatase [Thermoanaerobaculia bacterium]|nr:SpoIIE family protein phosphatase [Thermoanaerobaculia bacterium]